MIATTKTLDLMSRMVAISDFNKGKATQAFDTARDGEPVFVMKRNVPTAVILSFDEYYRMVEELEDADDYQQAVQRIASNPDDVTLSRDEALKAMGLDENTVRHAEPLEIS